MAQRSELVAMLAGGVSFYRILFTYLIVGCILSACSFYLTGYIVPQATANRVEFEYKYCKKKKVSRDRDIYKRVISDKKTKTEVYIYIQYFDNKEKEAHSFSMTKFVNNQMTHKLSAEKAVWVDSVEKWTLFDIRTRILHEKGEVLAFFPKKDTTFNITPDDIFIVEQKAETMNTPELIQFTKQEEIRGSEILKDLYTERYVRHASPFAFIILSMIGFAMSSRKSRGGMALQIGLGVVISILYIAMLLIGKLFVSETFPAWLAAWLPNIIFFPIAIILLRVAPK
jgi:lipopolysaccharide export system permease protein